MYLPDSFHDILLKLISTVYESKVFLENGLKYYIFPEKKGEKSDPNYYRGIALINTITKTFTSILVNRLTLWVERSNLLQQNQAGFRRGLSYIDHIFTLPYLVLRIYGEQKSRPLYAVSVDFRATFDTVSHNLL